MIQARRITLASLARIGLAAPVAIAGCVVFRRRSIPMHTLTNNWSATQIAPTLVVFLPGVYDKPEDFARHGFFDQVRKRQYPIDLIAADAHLGYFNDGSVAQRLHEDVVAPARRRGYRNVWLVGISLGGLAAMLYCLRYGDANGVVALAPFVGTRPVIAEVSRAQGLRHWRSAPAQPDDWERQLLAWLQAYVSSPGATPLGRPAMLVGWGREDRFADSLQAVFGEWPNGRRIVVPGGHDWPVWTLLWEQMLDAHGEELAFPS
jgi:pimeloyl-ACP methyl ester carboxylesterase